MTRRLHFALLLLLLPASALAAEPKAVAKAPATAAVGSVVRVDTTGMVSDSGPLVRVWSPPDGWQAHYTAAGDLIGFEVQRPGTYLFVSIASGTAADGSRVYVAIFAQTAVTGGSLPAPIPTPPPTPPTPTPQDDMPFTTAYRAYSGGMSAALASAANDMLAGKITTKQQFLDALRAHSAPFAKAVDDLFAPYVDASGKITNPAAVAGSLKAAAEVKP